MIRISAQQKEAMVLIHIIECSQGLHTPVHTSFLRKKVVILLGKEVQSNHFGVGLRTLEDNGYLVGQPNTDRTINRAARSNEIMWQLTEKGRMYAETLHSSRLRPKRSYRRKAK